MSVQNPFDKEENKLPSLLNVLTILSIIGCVFQFFSMPISKWLMGFAMKALENQEAVAKMSADDVEKMQKAKTVFELMEANSIPLDCDPAWCWPLFLWRIADAQIKKRWFLYVCYS